MDFIIVGSTNPVKFKAAETASQKYWPNVNVSMFDAEAKISPMPFSKQETRFGAKNRALHSRSTIDTGLGIGMEGGVIQLANNAYLFGTTFITDGDLGVYGGETLIPLPQTIFNKLLDGMIELGDVIDELTNKANTKQKHGAVGYLTNNIITRFDVFYNSVVMALAAWTYDIQNPDREK